MSVRLPRTGNIPPVVLDNADVMQPGWGIHEGPLVDDTAQSDMNYHNVGRSANSNIMQSRLYADNTFYVEAAHSYIIGGAMTVSNDGRGTLPMILGCTGSLHTVPASGSPIEDVRFVLLQQIFPTAGGAHRWQVVHQFPLGVYQMSDTTNAQVNNYHFDEVIAYTPELNVKTAAGYELTGLVGIFAVFYNRSTTNYAYDYLLSDVQFSISYKNRAVYNPEIN